MYRSVLIAAVAGLVASYALAADQPAADQRALPPTDSVERQSALDTSAYTSIPRVVFNSAGAASFLRFANGSGQSTTFDVKVVGGETGTDYTGGTAYSVTVPDKGSAQRSIDEIRTALLAQGADIALKSGDTFLNLFVTSPKAGSGAGFQHVTYNGVTGYFENVSVCTYDATADYAPLNRKLVNVHTSKLAGYPSKVEIHNPDAVSRVVRGKVYDAVTGTSIGVFTANVPAKATTVVEESAIEQQMSFQPTSSQLHINIEFETADFSAYTALVAHKVAQSSTGAVFNLTQICAVNAARPAAATFSAVTDTLTQTFTVGQPATIALGTLLNNDIKAGGATLESVTAFADALTGAPNGTYSTFTSDAIYTLPSGAGATYPGGITYTPARAGTVTFTYRLRSPAGEISNYATVVLTAAGATAPTITANSDTLTQVFQVGQSASIQLASLTANDTNVTSAATIESVTQPVDSAGAANGIYTQLPTVITYVPARTGTVTFTYRLSPGGGGAPSNFATVTLTVQDPNLPRPADDTLNQGFAVGIPASILFSTLTANDNNASGTTLKSLTAFVDAGTTSANGASSVTGSTITYTPARAGTVTFTYRLRNDSGLSYPATVTLTVAAATAKAPTAVDDTIAYTMPAGTLNSVQINLADVIGNDSDTAGATFDQSVALAFTATNGTVANFSVIQLIDRMLIDNLPAGSNTLTFNYRLKNSFGASNTAKVTVNVTKAQ